jgi:hypothetical protein
MSRSTTLSFSHLLVASATLLAALANPAVAQTEAQRAAATERHDVHAACLDIDASLKESIVPIWTREEPIGTFRVYFELSGTRIHDVRVAGLNTRALAGTRSAIRHAVQTLDCSNTATESQQFSFLIELRSPDAATAGDQRVALLTP